MSNQPARIDVDHVIMQVMPQFQRVAQKRQKVRWAEESQYALQCCKSNPALQACDPTTLQYAIINVAAVGLSLNPASGHAYLVPEFHKGSKRNTCCLRVSFRGLIKLATDSGSISWVKADVVKANDTFEYHGINNIPIHHMDPFRDRGETIGAYCIAKTASGDILTDVINREQLERIRNCAKTQNVWDNWFDEMAKKAIIKRAAKQWPPGKESEHLDEAIKIINEAEGTDFEEFQQLENTAAYIREHIEKEDIWGVGEAWNECTEKQQTQLWLAITKGGYFTQDEKKFIRNASQEYRKSCYALEQDKDSKDADEQQKEL